MVPINTVHEGTILEADGSFTCLEMGQRVEVWVDADGIPCVNCREGVHGLDGQLNDAGTHYVGFDKVGDLDHALTIKKDPA